VSGSVTIVGPVYPYRGGIAHYTAELAAQLAAAHTVRVHSFRSLYPRWLFAGRSQLEPQKTVGVAAGVATDYWLIPWWPPSWARVRREWAACKPDLVIFQWWVTFMAPMTAWLADRARQLGIPVVAVCHNVLPHERRALDARLARWALGPMDRLIVHSPAEKELAESLFRGKDVRAVAFPQSARISAWTRATARARLGLEGRLILFFGFVRPYKGLPDLIAAMPAVLLDGPATLLVVGEIWQGRQDLAQQLAGLGLGDEVRLVDRYVSTDEAAMYFAAADVVVLPYRHATTSAAVQMAFAFGVPVIATRAGSMAEAIDDGVTGFLVAPEEPSGLAQAIRRFFREERAGPFRAAIAEQRQRFSWEAVVDCLWQPAAEAHGVP
jgi:glycosyltransferase involved in cell wall biosynthesis